MNWLVKEEPDSYSFDRLVEDEGTDWSGVRNPLAQRHLRAIRRGDGIFYYHTGSERAVVGIARAASDAGPDPADRTGRNATVRIVPVKRLAHPVPLAALKADPAFAHHPIVRMGRLSVMPISDREWSLILKRAERGDAGNEVPRKPRRKK
ncbi:MAG TPA: EVE domain-containing protein [Candidatus Polarisedimenticolia bacterium]|nr:EVE domain-containing protein [Candidatus Polarisedimenticolia bacterium]